MNAALDSLPPFQKRIVEALIQESMPTWYGGVYVGGTDTNFFAPIVTTLIRGIPVVGHAYGVNEKPRLVAAFPDGSVTVDGEPVKLRLNLDKRSTLVLRREGSPEDWAPHLEVPGSIFDAAMVFYALLGWQNAEMIATAALGCEECTCGLVPVEGAGAGRMFVSCSCQGPDIDPDDLPPAQRAEDDLAREEPGTWYGGAAGLAWAEAA